MIMVLRLGILTCIICFSVLSPIFKMGQSGQLELENLFGILCLSIFCVTIVLGFRSHLWNQVFGSLTYSYRIHHYLTFAFFIAFIVHIISYSYKYFLDGWSLGIQSLTLLEDPIIFTGWLSFLIVVMVFLFSYYKKWGRKLWKSIHRLVFLGFIISLIHFWKAKTWIGVNRIELFFLILLTLVLTIINYLFPDLLRKTSPYVVEEVKSLNSMTTEIKLSPLRNQIQFEPGQFVYVSIQCTMGCGVSHEFHPFTLDSSPLNSHCLSVAVRALGDDTKNLIHIVPGNQAIVEGPYGNLLHGINPQKKQVWIAGGIGVTPFISYIRRWKLELQPDDNINLLLFLKNQTDYIFASELESTPGLKLTQHYDDLQGTVNELKFKQMLPKDIADRDVIISGPEKMVQLFKNELHKMGITSIRTEEFT